MRKQNLIMLLVFLLTAVLSVYILDYYVKGDQEHYVNFYNSISSVTFQEVSGIAQAKIGAREPASLFVFWFGSHVLNLDKTIWFSLINGVFMSLLYKFLSEKSTPIFVMFLCATNFYVLVLLFSAERLKLAFLLILLALTLSGRKKYLLFLSSPFMHFQALIFFFSAFLYSQSQNLRKLFTKLLLSKDTLFVLCILVLSIALIIVINYDGFWHKVDMYFYREIGNMEMLITLLKTLFFMLVSIKESKNKFSSALPFIPLILFGYLLGGQRMNMMSFSVFVYILATERKLHKPLPILILLYFSIKSISFVEGIFDFGDGFGHLSF